MKILFAIPEVGAHGGTERWAYEVLRRLSTRHEITVHTSFARGLHGRAHVRRIPRLRWPGVANFLSFAAAHAALRALDRARYDLVAATGADDPRADVLTVHFVAETRRRMMAERRIAPTGNLLRRAHARAYAAVTAGAERFAFTRPSLRALLCVSELVAREVIALGADPACVKVIPNGVDADAFRPADGARRAAARLALGLAADARVVLFVGGDWDRKNLAGLVRAHVSLADPRQVLLVAGHGDPRPLQAPPSVRFLGAVPDVAPLYAAADVFAYPTLYEPFGLAPLEAMAAGVPTLVSRAAGVAALCQDGRDALLLDRPEDPARVAQALRTLFDNAELRRRLAAGGRALAEAYSWDACARRTEEAWLAAAEEKARPTSRLASP